MANIYDQVDQNKFRSSLVLFIFVGFFAAAAFIITKSFNLSNYIILGAIGFSTLSSIIGYFFGDQIALKMNQARLVGRDQYFDFFTVTENLCIASGIPVPKIYVTNDSSPNAFATGRDPKHASICATTGLLQMLNRTELEGVIAHELSHVKNYDTRLMTLVSILVGSVSLLINLANQQRYASSSEDDTRARQASFIFTILSFVFITFAPVIAKLIQLAISRRREYLADASAALLTRQPQGLIDALIKVSSDTSIPQTASTATASLYIVNPFKLDKLASLFSTHPPIADRVQALRAML